jgi:hypothetical protein
MVFPKDYVSSSLKTQWNLDCTKGCKLLVSDLLLIFIRELMVKTNILCDEIKKILKVQDASRTLELWLVNYPELYQKIHDYGLGSITRMKEYSGEKLVSKQKKAGLTMPITRVGHLIKKLSITPQISLKVAIYISAVIDYISKYLCYMAGDMAQKRKKKRVITRDVIDGISNDKFLSFLFRNCFSFEN